MAYIATEDQKASAGPQPTHLAEPATTTAQNIVISPAGMTEIPVPGQGFVTNAVMTQDGADLVLESADGVTIVIEGYFSADTPPDLISPDGKVLTPALVKSFIQASNDFAEDQTAMNDTTPVGQVGEVSGHATVTHANGTTETITKGTPIFEGDVVETDAKGAVNIKFADESSFAVSNNAKMAIDEFVFDTASNSGENKFSMLRGLFVYTSGLVGREDPDDVQINTPVGSIGIRGTIITGVLPQDGSSEPAQISVIEGAIVIHPLHGAPDITLSKQFETVHIDTGNGTATNVGVLPQGDMAETFNVLRTVAPTLFSAMEEAQQEAPQPADAPVQQDVAPTDVPQEAPVQPVDPIQLNLLPDRLNTDPFATTPLETVDETLETSVLEPVAEVVGTGGILTVASIVLDAAQTADNNTSVAVPPTTPNTPPLTLTNAYTAFEQSGVANGGVFDFNIGRFFRDLDGDTLTYSITGTGGTAGIATNISTSAGHLYFEIDSGMSVATASFTVVIRANDGVATSTPIVFTVNAYDNTTGGGSTGADVENLTISGKRFSMLSGDDDVNYGSTTNNYIWGGSGNDSATISSSANKFFGEDGDDTINVFSGTGNFISGGNGNDTLTVFGTGTTIFGGDGDDVITINATAAAGLSAGSTFLDAGTGFDILRLNGVTGFNLNSIINTQLLSIEKIDAGTSSVAINLDLRDILEHTSEQRLFLDVDGNDTVNVTNTSAMTALTNTGTYVDGADTYNVWSNGNLTLYVNQAALGVTGL